MTSRAEAEPTSEERTLAEALFREAKQLMDQGRHGDACPKLAQSHLLDPGGGTLLNLAVCHEAEGRLATAWSELREALAMARRDGRRDREELALSRLESLEPRLSRVRIVVTAPEAAGLVVHRGGASVPRAAWGTAVPVDAGEHVIEATAPGRVPFRATLRVSAEGVTETMTIPALAVAPRSRSPRPPAPPTPVGEAPGSTPHRTAGIALTFLGVALGVGGTLAGAIAVGRKLESDDACRGGCTREGVALADEAAAAAIAADVGLAVGFALSATGVALWLTAPPGAPSPVAPGRGVATGGSLALRARF